MYTANIYAYYAYSWDRAIMKHVSGSHHMEILAYTVVYVKEERFPVFHFMIILNQVAIETISRTKIFLRT